MKIKKMMIILFIFIFFSQIYLVQSAKSIDIISNDFLYFDLSDRSIVRDENLTISWKWKYNGALFEGIRFFTENNMEIYRFGYNNTIQNTDSTPNNFELNLTETLHGKYIHTFMIIAEINIELSNSIIQYLTITWRPNVSELVPYKLPNYIIIICAICGLISISMFVYNYLSSCDNPKNENNEKCKNILKIFGNEKINNENFSSKLFSLKNDVFNENNQNEIINKEKNIVIKEKNRENKERRININKKVTKGDINENKLKEEENKIEILKDNSEIIRSQSLRKMNKEYSRINSKIKQDLFE